MSCLWSLLLAEARKQSRLKLPYLGLAAVVIMGVMWPQLSKNYTDISATLPLTGYEFVADAMTAISTSLIPVFCAIFAATLVASETSHGTMRYVLCRPISRPAFLAAKFITGFVYAALLSAVAAVVLAGVGAVAIGYNTTRDAMLGVNVNPREFWLQFAAACALGLVPAFATVSFGLWLSVLFRNAGAAVGVAAGALVVMEPFKYIEFWKGFTLDPYMWTSYFDPALHLVKKCAIGTPDLWNTPEMARAMIVPACWIAVFAVMSTIIMRRRDWN